MRKTLFILTAFGAIGLTLWPAVWLWSNTPRKEPAGSWASNHITGLPVYSFNKTNESPSAITNQAWSTNASPQDILNGRITYFFSTTNVDLIFTDTNGVKFKGQWVREFTNAFKWREHTTNEVADGIRTNTYPSFTFKIPQPTVWLYGPVTYTEQGTNHWMSFITNGLMQWRKTQ